MFAPQVGRAHEAVRRFRIAQRRAIGLRGTGQIRHDQPENPTRPEQCQRTLQRQPHVLQRKVLEHVAGIEPVHAPVRHRQALDDVAVADPVREPLRIALQPPEQTAKQRDPLKPQSGGGIEVEPPLACRPASAELHVSCHTSSSSAAVSGPTGDQSHLTSDSG
jgi:hypothetical protein